MDRYASVGDETTCIEESPLDIVGCRVGAPSALKLTNLIID